MVTDKPPPRRVGSPGGRCYWWARLGKKEIRETKQRLIKVIDVTAFMVVANNMYSTVIHCQLEDGRSLSLYHVPYEIVIALNNLEQIEETAVVRASIFDILPQLAFFKEGISKILHRVIIDKLDLNTGLYTATAEFRFGELIVKRNMIPSHAIYLATVAGKPIYVTEELVSRYGEEE